MKTENLQDVGLRCELVLALSGKDAIYVNSDPSAVQPVASRYTAYAMVAHNANVGLSKT
jgi:hypothetical protein